MNLQAEYHVVLGPFNDFAAMVIQFGYATMFISAYPLATVLAFVNNYVCMRVDAWKLCQICRRPEPRSCEDIGTWYAILEIISTSAVLVNSALVAFTSTIPIDYSWYNRVWIFFGMSFGILLVKTVVSVVIPDMPLEVEIQLKRKAYILSKIVDNVPDEINNFGDMSNKVEYSIKVTDDDPL